MKLPAVTPREVIKALERAGFYKKRQKGSHVIYKHPDGRWTVVPIHARIIPKGTLRAILREAQINPEDFARLLNE